MSRYAAFLLLLAFIPWNFCAADYDYPDEYDPNEKPTTVKPTTATPETTSTTTTTATPTTTTAAPTTTTTTTTTADPTTTTPKQTTPPTTTKPTPAPTTTTPPPTTTKTTVAPTTSTTAAPTTTTTTANATTPTAAPNTTVTSTTPTPTTTPAPLPDPASTTYQVKNGNDTCLMVKFGLRIGYRGDKYEEMNLNPNTTAATGVCAEDNSTLVLHADSLTLSFTFRNDTKKFSLLVLSAIGNLTSGTPVSEVNNSLKLWQASLGNSYMCNKQQNSNITTKLTISTFELQVQPFGVKKNTFSTAEECMADGENFTVPIAVGVALLVLILIVVVAYFIGRKRNMASGYESF